MKVNLAGFNFDFNQIKNFSSTIHKLNNCEKLKEQFDKIHFTPESIAAAYARISRSKKPVDILRQDALVEISKSRKSNREIVFEMGHSSIAEHSIFNFDVIGISRYLTEFVQKSRLVSFTEKSQRYVTLKGDFVLPNEIENNSEASKKFRQIIEKQNQAYFTLCDCLEKFYNLQYNSKKAKKIQKKKIETKAKEDARYIISLATKTQFGMTINARNVEKLLKRLYAINLNEANALADKIYNNVKTISPSLIRYTKPSEFDKKRYSTLSENKIEKIKNEIISFPENCDEKILTTLIFRENGNRWKSIFSNVVKMSFEEKKIKFLRYLDGIKSFDSLPREFEIGEFIFQLNISASCFAQLKRHRMSTIISSDYSPENCKHTIPESIVKCGKKKLFENVINETEFFYFWLKKHYPQIKNYILTNSHNRGVLFKFNLRELCHFSRLREDSHSQWEIRKIANEIVSECRKIAPLSTMLICGKDKFEQFYKKHL